MERDPNTHLRSLVPDPPLDPDNLNHPETEDQEVLENLQNLEMTEEHLRISPLFMLKD